MDADLEALQKMIDAGFPGTIGIRITSARKDRVTAELAVTPELCTMPQPVLHGGAIMSLADTLGAVATFLNLPAGSGTTTLESKTNFLGAAPAGSSVVAECTPVHVGRSTMVWQTRVTLSDGKLVALVTQTQMVLAPRP